MDSYFIKTYLDRIYRINRKYFIFLSFLTKLRNFIRFAEKSLNAPLYIAGP